MIAFVRKNRDFYEVIEINKEVTALLEKGAAVMVEVPLRELLKHSIEYKGELYRDIINFYNTREDDEKNLDPINISIDDMAMLEHLLIINDKGYFISAIKQESGYRKPIYFYKNTDTGHTYVDMSSDNLLKLYGEQYNAFSRELLQVNGEKVSAIQRYSAFDSVKFMRIYNGMDKSQIRLYDIILRQPEAEFYIYWTDKSAFEQLHTKEDSCGDMLMESDYKECCIRADEILYDSIKNCFVTPGGDCLQIFRKYKKKLMEDILKDDVLYR